MRMHPTLFLVPLAILMAFVLPTVLGLTWGDPLGAFIWGGLVVRIAGAQKCFS
jgi:stearoyl-CoA desaturase (Delta-9 desaturase)